MEDPITHDLITATASRLHLIADLDLESLPERLDDSQWAAVKRIMDAPLPSLPPCGETHLLQCLRAMLAVLPRQNSDDVAGELFVEMYRSQLGEHPADAISYLVVQATRQCRWFPTIAECLEIITGWRRHDADTMRKAAAHRRYHDERIARMGPRPSTMVDPWHPTPEELAALKAETAKRLSANR